MTYEEIKKNMPEEYQYVQLQSSLFSSARTSMLVVEVVSQLIVRICSHLRFLGLFIARARKKDKLRYRYPRGESYLDVIQRYAIFYFFIQNQSFFL